MNEKQKLEQYQDIMMAAQRTHVDSSPFLKTRVLSHLDELSRKEKSLFKWKLTALGMASLCLVLVFSILTKKNTPLQASLQAQVDQAVIVRIETEALRNSNKNLAQAVVELPDGVIFFSKKHPQLSEKREISLNLNAIGENSYLPIPIKGMDLGTKHLIVKFYDQNKELIEVRSVSLNFKEGI